MIPKQIETNLPALVVCVQTTVALDHICVYCTRSKDALPFGYCSVTTVGISKILASSAILLDTSMIWGKYTATQKVFVA